MLKEKLKTLRREVRLPIFLMSNRDKAAFNCPICNYTGPFMDSQTAVATRLHAECPKCGALERHRLQYVVLEQLLPTLPVSKMRMLHFSPEPFFREYFGKRMGKYETANLAGAQYDHNVDMTALPFPDASYDFVFASHVLEHIVDDAKAMSEVRRVLAPGGVAILPVPMVAERTIEYPEPSPQEAWHVRAPGPDYYDRLRPLFARVDIYGPDDLPEQNQLRLYEDRTQWPSAACPWRPAMEGERHVELVPVCFV